MNPIEAEIPIPTGKWMAMMEPEGNITVLQLAKACQVSGSSQPPVRWQNPFEYRQQAKAEVYSGKSACVPIVLGGRRAQGEAMAPMLMAIRRGSSSRSIVEGIGDRQGQITVTVDGQLSASH
jgi:hypothetical protein